MIAPMSLRTLAMATLVVATPFISACESAVTAEGGRSPIRQERIPFGELPSVTTRQGGFIWVLDRWGNKLGKIDPTTNEVVAEWDLNETFRGDAWDLDAAAGSLWVTVPSKRRFFELDPSSGEVLSTIRTKGHSSDIYVAGGSLWFSDDGRTGVDLVQASAASGKVIRKYRLGKTNSHVVDVVAFDGSIWVTRSCARYVGGTSPNATFFMTAHLWRIDARSDRVVSRLPLGSTYTRGPVNPVIGDVETGPQGLWTSRNHERRVVLTKPMSGQLAKVFSISDFELPWEFEYVNGHLWVGDLNRPRVKWLNPETREEQIVEVGADTSFIGRGFGSVWLPVGGGAPGTGEVVRLTYETE